MERPRRCPPREGDFELCRLGSFQSMKTAAPTVSSIHSSQRCFILPLITGPTRRECSRADQQIGNQSP